MALNPWPDELPINWNTDNFQYTPGTTSLRSEMDVGPEKVRSRFTDAVDQYQVTMYVDFDQVAVFNTFYKTNLTNGVQQFQFLNPLTSTTDNFRFISTPNITPLGGRAFTLNMAWERLP